VALLQKSKPGRFIHTGLQPGDERYQQTENGINDSDILAHIPSLHERRFAFAPKGLRLKAQGCRFGYPGKKVIRASNRKAVATGSGLVSLTQPPCG